jgi:hypothetical protein
MLGFLKRAILSFIIAFLAMNQSGSCAFSSYEQESVPVISRIIINNDSILLPFSVRADSQKIYNGNLRLRHSDNNIAFDIGSDRPLEYQFMLNGYSDKWSLWQKHNFKEYTNLSSGHYSFIARYRDTDQIIHSLKPVLFTVCLNGTFLPRQLQCTSFLSLFSSGLHMIS